MRKHLLALRFLALLILAFSAFFGLNGVAPVVAGSPANPAQLPSLAGTVYYVATTGNDANPGTATQPWRTIQKAANTAVAGDTVTVNAGSYSETVVESKSGTDPSTMISFVANGTVTIKAFYLQGNYIKLQGFTVTPTDCGTWDGAIHATGSYNVVHRNIVKDSTRQGIVTGTTTSGSTFSGNTIARANVNGMAIYGSNNLVENNDISDIQDHMGACSLWSDANGVEFHGSGHTFRGNYIHDFYKSHQNSQEHMDAFQTFSDMGNNNPAGKNIVFERNHVVMGNPSTGALEEAWNDVATIYGFMIEGNSSDQASNITVRNNVIEAWGGLNIGGGKNVANLKVYNNDWRSSLSFNSSYGPTGIHIDAVAVYQIYNNTIVDFSYAHILVDNNPTGGTWGYNLMWNSNGSTPGSPGYVFQPNDKRGINPKFISDFGNLHLQAGSPAIDAGTNIAGVTNDFDGTARPQGTYDDIGAYEYVSATSTPTPTALSATTATSIPTLARTATSTATRLSTATRSATPPPAATSTPTVSAVTNITLSPAADAYVSQSNKSTNYGSATQLRVDGSPRVNTYIRFSVQGVATGVAKAVLRIYANSALNSGFDVRAVSNNSWGESTITYNNAPAMGNTIASTGAVSASTWVSVDLTSYIRGNGTFSFALTDPSVTAMSLASRESTNAPKLMITTK